MTSYARVAQVEVETTDGDALQFDAHRISFDVYKSRQISTNNATIQIYNVAKGSRDLLNKRNARIRLLAGYRQESGLESVFVGRASYLSSTYAPPDIITRLEAQDGIEALRQTRVALSYVAGANCGTILADIAAQLRLPLRAQLPAMTNKPEWYYKNGYVFLGSARDALTQVCSRIGAEWSIHDTTLLIIPQGGSSENTGVLISPETGLIGSPQKMDVFKGSLDGVDDNAPQWRITSLLRPVILPSNIVQVKSREIDGFYIVDNVTHSGDTMGSEFLTTLEVRPL